MRTLRRITLALAAASFVATILVACQHPHPGAVMATTTTSEVVTTTTTEAPSTTEPATVPPAPRTVTTQPPATAAPVTRSVVADPTATVAKARSGCPPDPEIPGVAYYCGAGAANGHRGQTCINHPPECAPGTASISVDPTIGDAYCALANEEDNYAHGGAQRDIYGTCPLTHTGPDVTLVIDVAVIAMVGAILVLLIILIRRDHHHS